MSSTPRHMVVHVLNSKNNDTPQKPVAGESKKLNYDPTIVRLGTTFFSTTIVTY